MKKDLNKFNKKSTLFFLGIIIILFITNILSFVFLKKENIYKTLNKYPYIDFSRNFIDQKHYITNLQPLRVEIKELLKTYSGKFSVYIEFLNTGANISINQETYIFPASLLKLPVAMVAMKKVELGEWKLGNELVLLEGDKDDKSGDVNNLLAKNGVGSRFKISDLIISALRDSDNTAFNILYRNVSDAEVEKFIEATGLDQISDPSGRISAKEYSRMLRSLYTASYLNRENSQLLLTWLDESTFNEFLAGVIDEEISFPHKYGENLSQNVFGDSGIVYLKDRPYIISVILEGDQDQIFNLNEVEKAKELMQKISTITFNYFKDYNN